MDDRPTHGDTADDPSQSIEIHHHNNSFSSNFTEHSPDLPDIPTPDAYRAAVDAQYRKHAIEQGCARVREIEENVVPPAMLRIESKDPYRHLVGLDHRLKAKTASPKRSNPTFAQVLISHITRHSRRSKTQSDSPSSTRRAAMPRASSLIALGSRRLGSVSPRSCTKIRKL